MYSDDDVRALREALATADYTVEAVDALLGPVAAAALGRAEFAPLRRATAGGSPLETLVRLFLAGAAEPYERVAAALPIEPALAHGLVVKVGDEVQAGLDLRPYESWWVVSDLGAELAPGPLRTDHVLGVGGASLSLANAVVRRPAATALDLGIGCGVQSLHLSTHVDRVTGTDVNPRALELSALTARLNGLDWELLEGSFTSPVAGRRFDLVVSNPPFVVGPGDSGYTYRDSGVAGDAACRDLIRDVPDLLEEGGWCQLLANWAHVDGEPWTSRVAGWLEGSGCDAWVWQREVQDPAEYAALWLRDGGEEGSPAYERKYEEWLDWFASRRITGVGFGLVTLRRTGGASVRVEEVRQAVQQPVGPHVGAWFDRQDWLASVPDLLDARLRAAPDAVLEQVASRGPEGWDVDVQRLHLTDGLRWQIDVDPVAAALVAGCDGTHRLGDQLAVLAQAFGYGTDELVNGALPVVARFIERGFLLP